MNNRWETLSFTLPDKLGDVRDSLHAAADTLNAALEVVNAALELVKTFTLAYIDPIAATINSLISYILSVIEDFRKMGIYITGDWSLLQGDYSKIKGGFSSYESRMSARFTDMSDPTRPDIAPTVDVGAVFMYIGADTTVITKILTFMQAMAQLLHRLDLPQASFSVPQIVSVRYASESTSFTSLGNLLNSPINRAKITWKLSAPPEPRLIPSLPPKGFLVSISTLPNGIPLAYSRPKLDAGTKTVGSSVQDQRESGRVLDITGKPVVLYGGADMLKDSYGVYNSSVTGLSEGKTLFSPSSVQVYGLTDDTQSLPIPLEKLRSADGTTYFFQRSFVVSALNAGLQWPTMNYSCTIDYKDLPHHARPIQKGDGTLELEDLGLPSTVYVRALTLNETLDAPPRYDLRIFESGTTGKFIVTQSKSDDSTISPNSMSGWSNSSKVTFPYAKTKECLDAVQKALVVLALSRPDIKLRSEGGVALLPTGLEGYRSILDLLYDNAIPTTMSPMEFRRDLLQRVKSLASKVISRSYGNPQFLAQVVDLTPHLRNVTLDQLEKTLPGQTLLSMLESSNERLGVANSPDFRGQSSGAAEDAPVVQGDNIEYWSQPLDLPDPVFAASKLEVPDLLYSAPKGLRIYYEAHIKDDGSMELPTNIKDQLQNLVDKSYSYSTHPIMYNTNGEIFSARYLLRSYQGELLFTEAKAALDLIFSTMQRQSDGQWLSYRLSDVLPEIDTVYRTVEAWLKSYSATVTSTADAIRAYVDFVEGRIRELQNTIRRIDSLLQNALRFSIATPKCSGLLLVGKGTQGVLKGLQSAQNKPSSNDTYGAGIAIVAPLAPSFIMSLFSLSPTEEVLTQVTTPQPMFGPDSVALIPPAPVIGPNDPPDVL